ARINAAIEAAMDSLRHQPRLLVKVAPEAIDAVRAHIEDMCAEHAYVGAVLLRAQAGLRKGEVVIDWSDGVVSSSPQETEARISALVEAALAAPETH
ncbi:MAG TPA: FliH/SctL family protein, partial [Terricaulis sp.]|nr:FliH/SctL family protein [Terricaulis sp.]